METAKIFAFPNVVKVETIKDLADYFNILFTLLIALGVFWIAVQQWRTSKKQAEHEILINSEKIKHDLYDRRFAIFTAAKEILLLAMGLDKLPFNKLYEFRNKLSDAEFLFGNDVNGYLDKLYKELVQYRKVNNKINSKSSYGNRDILEQEENTLLVSFEAQLKSLHEQFARYMKFKL